MSVVIAYVPLSGNKVAVRYGADPEEAEGDMVSGVFFSGLGVKLQRGHGFTEQDEKESFSHHDYQQQLLDPAVRAKSGCAGCKPFM